MARDLCPNRTSDRQERLKSYSSLSPDSLYGLSVLCEGQPGLTRLRNRPLQPGMTGPDDGHGDDSRCNRQPSPKDSRTLVSKIFSNVQEIARFQ